MVNLPLLFSSFAAISGRPFKTLLTSDFLIPLDEARASANAPFDIALTLAAFIAGAAFLGAISFGGSET